MNINRELLDAYKEEYMILFDEDAIEDIKLNEGKLKDFLLKQKFLNLNNPHGKKTLSKIKNFESVVKAKNYELVKNIQKEINSYKNSNSGVPLKLRRFKRLNKEGIIDSITVEAASDKIGARVTYYYGLKLAELNGISVILTTPQSISRNKVKGMLKENRYRFIKVLFKNKEKERKYLIKTFF